MNDQSTDMGGGLRPHPTRAVHRAIGELRRGAAVLVAGERPMVMLAAETAASSSLWEAGIVAGGAGPVRLVVSAGRAGVEEGDGLVAFTIATSFDALAQGSPSWLRDLADPTRQDPGIDFAGSFGRAPLPAGAAAALAAVKLARLAPAAILVETDQAAEDRAARCGMGVADAGSFLAFAHQVAAGLEVVADAAVPLEDAPDARLVAFRAPDGGIEHLAVVIGDPTSLPAPLVRVHSECFTGDFLGSLRCDCGDQLRGAIRRMSAEGAGVLLYLAQEGRGIGLVNKLRAYALQDRGLDTLDANRALGWDADERTFLTAATMLQRLGIGRIRLLTNNPDKVAALAGFGVEVVERVGHVIAANGVNDQYLATKRQRFGHLFG